MFFRKIGEIVIFVGFVWFLGVRGLGVLGCDVGLVLFRWDCMMMRWFWVFFGEDNDFKLFVEEIELVNKSGSKVMEGMEEVSLKLNCFFF